MWRLKLKPGLRKILKALLVSVHEQKYSPAMSLGLEFECSSLGAIDSLCFVSACKVATTPLQWMTQVSLWDGPFTVIVSVGQLGINGDSRGIFSPWQILQTSKMECA